MLWLWILGILLLLFVLVCRTRLGVRAVFGRNMATADVTVGLFRFRVAPGKSVPDKKKAPQKPKVKKKPKEQTASLKIPKPTWEEVKDAYHALAPACKRALQRTRRSIRVHPLDLSVTVAGGEDPAAAAEIYGELHMGVWTVMPALEQLLVIPDPHIHIGIDFDAAKMEAAGEFGISIRIGTLLGVGFGIGIPALKWVLRFRKQHKKKPPVPAPAAGAAEHTAA